MVNFYIIATPIGNYNDISLRSIEILKKIDFIVCESEKEYKKLFNYHKIELKKFIVYNKNDENSVIQLTIELLNNNKIGALITDCGTPLFEDPGYNLIKNIREKNFIITSIPGPSSVITAISMCPFEIKDYYFAGFISNKKYVRENDIIKILKRKETIILMETPYRLKNIIDILKKYLNNRKICLTYNLTMDNEEIIYGNILEVEKILNKKNIIKGEFIIIIEKKV